MNIPPTGSVEQLYSPSYGSRGSSSLSIHSAMGNLQRNSSFKSQDSGSVNIQYSSMPMVYFSSQDRLNKHSRVGSNSDSDSLSLLDRLKPHLQPHEIEILASKARGVQHPPPHTRYASHFYTPTRTRKRPHKDVKRSASIGRESLGIYRSSSDGTRRGQGKPAVNEPLSKKTKRSKVEKNPLPKKTSPPIVQPGVNTISLDDMPPLPPTVVTADISTDSPVKVQVKGSSPPDMPSSVQEIESILQSVERRRSDEGIESSSPLILPHQSPHTPVETQEPPHPETPASIQTSPSFDYSELGSPPQIPHSMTDEDFQFSSPPPIPGSSPPRDEERDSIRESPGTAVVEPLESSTPVREGWRDKPDIDRTITPRRALVEAYKQLDRIGESHLGDSGDETGPTPQSPPLVTVEEEGDSEKVEDGSKVDEGPTLEVPQFEDHIYAKVVMSKKKRGRKDQEEDKVREEEEDVEADEEPPPIPPYRVSEETSHTEPEPPNVNTQQTSDPGYEDLEFGPKTSTQNLPISVPEEPGYTRIKDIMKRPSSEDYSEVHTVVTLEGAGSGDNVRKASSEANVSGIDLAVVHHPQRASMPPDVLPSDMSPDYETIKPLPEEQR